MILKLNCKEWETVVERDVWWYIREAGRGRDLLPYTPSTSTSDTYQCIY